MCQVPEAGDRGILQQWQEFWCDRRAGSIAGSGTARLVGQYGFGRLLEDLSKDTVYLKTILAPGERMDERE